MDRKQDCRKTFISDDIILMTSSVNAVKRKRDGIFGVTM